MLLVTNRFALAFTCLAFSSTFCGCVMENRMVDGPKTNPVENIRETQLSQLPMVLGVSPVQGDFASRYGARGPLAGGITDESREEARAELAESVRTAMIDYLTGSHLFKHVVAVPPDENTDVVLTCRLNRYETDFTILSGSVALSTSVSVTSMPTIAAQFELHTSDGIRWPFEVSHSWPSRTFKQTAGAGTNRAAGAGRRAAAEARAYHTQALEEFLSMVLEEIEAKYRPGH